MNGHHGRHHRGDDPVEEFFAAHRRQVRDEPADELAWQRIRDGRRRDRTVNRGAWVGGLVAAAAALAVVLGPSLLPDADRPDVAGPPNQEMPSVDATGPLPSSEATESPDQLVTAPVPDGEIPEGAWFTDTTTADPGADPDSGVRFGLVARDCPTDGFCALLVRSADGGLSWVPQADLEQLGLVDRVMFTDPRRGWAWGAKSPLWGTTDGGATWSTIPTGASRVLDVSVRDDILLATTATDLACPSSPCQLPAAALVLTDPTDVDWSDDVASDLGPASAAEVLDSGTERYVTVADEGGRVTSMLRLQGGRLETTAPLVMCEPGPVAVAAAASDGSHLFALCDDQAGLAVQESTNGGRTWAPLNLPVPSFVLGEQPPLVASADAPHLVLVGEGNYAVTTDGGRTWSAEAFLPGAEAQPAAIEVTRSGEIIVYPTSEQAGPDLAFWRSEDAGATWEVVTPRG
ncbi:MAG TPA: hypothetical protein VK045_06285 [Ornithinicoccus sp.]|nr:hypothetical protein [Ornithinicoccus sp.]